MTHFRWSVLPRRTKRGLGLIRLPRRASFAKFPFLLQFKGMLLFVIVPARRGKGGDGAFTLCPIDTRRPAHHRLYFCDLVVSRQTGGRRHLPGCPSLFGDTPHAPATPCIG